MAAAVRQVCFYGIQLVTDESSSRQGNQLESPFGVWSSARRSTCVGRHLQAGEASRVCVVLGSAAPPKFSSASLRAQ